MICLLNVFISVIVNACDGEIYSVFWNLCVQIFWYLLSYATNIDNCF